MEQYKRARRSLVTGMGAAAAAVALADARSGAQARPTPTAFAPARHDQDAWLDRLPGRHRMILDATTAAGAGEAIGFANNLFTGNTTGYGLQDNDLAMVICLRHFATLFAFTDPLWAKHGKQMASMIKYESRTGEPPSANPHNTAPRAANMIPNSRFAAAGVVGVTRAQEYGYSLLFVG